jgi:hypothetical protein
MSKRIEKGFNKKWVDRIDIVSAQASSKNVSQTSFPVNTFEDVIARQVVAQPRFAFCIVFCFHMIAALRYFPNSCTSVWVCQPHPQSYSVWSFSITLSSGTRLNDVVGESLNIKSLRGIDSFMHPL